MPGYYVLCIYLMALSIVCELHLAKCWSQKRNCTKWHVDTGIWFIARTLGTEEAAKFSYESAPSTIRADTGVLRSDRSQECFFSIDSYAQHDLKPPEDHGC